MTGNRARAFVSVVGLGSSGSSYVDSGTEEGLKFGRNSPLVQFSFIFTSGHHRRETGWWYDLNLQHAGTLES